MNVLNCEELKAATESGAKIVDVREPMELRSGRLHKAVNIPMRDLQEMSKELNRDDEIMVYCRTGQRSAYAEFMLLGLGFSNVKNIGGVVHYRECLV